MRFTAFIPVIFTESCLLKAAYDSHSVLSSVRNARRCSTKHGELAISDWVFIEAFYTLVSVQVFQDGNEVTLMRLWRICR
ncbi:hypothetical protein [Anaplasma phagocytophilum]|uniref:hypothetical protein n=1 Tax=Anaplasma phagocytophilum TaxID=948 RepID=UPI000A7A26DD|nr:hypothetical protein [Anaplasma phagocytophilum]